MGSYNRIRSGWEKMFVGPSLEKDERRRKEDSVCKVAQGIYCGQKSIGSKALLTEWDVNKDRLKRYDINMSSSKQVPKSTSLPVRSSPISFQASSSGKGPLFFGSSSVVVERNERALRAWKRGQGVGVKWVQRGGK